MTTSRPTSDTAASVIHFWDENETKWFIKDFSFDQEIKKKFSPLYEAAIVDKLKSWEDEPESLLALIILLDQFSRNMFRGTPKSFQSDLLALQLTKKALALDFKNNLTESHQKFLYMPLMHSEVLADQDLSVMLFSKFNDANSLAYAKAHRDIIAHFGRFPHRNQILGRESTPEELSFLMEPGSSF